MSTLSLREFQNLLGLTDSALVTLLERGTVACSINEKGEIRVEAKSLSIEELQSCIAQARTLAISTIEPLLQERVARLLTDEFSAIVEEAISTRSLYQEGPERK